MSPHAKAGGFPEDSGAQVHIVMVCTGNICRSPMAEVMLADALEDAGLNDVVDVSSCGIGGWHVGQGADKRAVAELAAHGLDGSKHRAAQFNDRHAKADLICAMDASHVRQLVNLGVPRSAIRLLRSFDPAAPHAAEVDDPYYGGAADFAATHQSIADAIPGLVSWAQAFVRDCSDR